MNEIRRIGCRSQIRVVACKFLQQSCAVGSRSLHLHVDVLNVAALYILLEATLHLVILCLEVGIRNLHLVVVDA